MAKHQSEFEAQMAHLEGEIRRLEAEFNMFFAGRLPRPPWETRAKVAALVKRHDQSFIRNTADRFRFESLHNRFSKFLELWERQMTNKELGRPTMGARRAQPPPAAPAEEAAPPPAKTKEKSRVHKPKEKVAEKSPADDRVKQLYEQLAEAKKQVGEKPIEMERLAALVKAQTDKFRAEGKDVSFKVALKDGKVQLTAKAADDKKKD